MSITVRETINNNKRVNGVLLSDAALSNSYMVCKSSENFLRLLIAVRIVPT